MSSTPWCECRRTEAQTCADELPEGRSKTKAENAAAEIARWCEERTVIEAYCRYVTLLRDLGLSDFAFLQRYAHDMLAANRISSPSCASSSA